METVVLILIVVIAAGVVLPALSRPRGCNSRQVRDQMAVRGLAQAMIVWSDSNGGELPLPSRIDLSDSTVPEPGRTKDTTGNILSLLIFQGMISPEMCVSAAEASPDVRVCDTYAYQSPTSAQRPEYAQWDPAFRGTPMDRETTGPANQSFAHILPIGRRLLEWNADRRPLIGNRGPEFAPEDSGPAVDPNTLPLPCSVTGQASNTLLIHGRRSSWEGNIAYADGSAQFETNASPDAVTYQRRVGSVVKTARDNLFVNETDESTRDQPTAGQSRAFDRNINAYLRPVARLIELPGPPPPARTPNSPAAGDSPLRPVLWKD